MKILILDIQTGEIEEKDEGNKTSYEKVNQNYSEELVAKFKFLFS